MRTALLMIFCIVGCGSTRDVTTVPQEAAACMGGGNVFHATGDAADSVTRGETWHVDGGKWLVDLRGWLLVPHSHLYMNKLSNDDHFFLELTTFGLGHGLRVGRYANAVNPIAPDGHPGMVVGIDYHGCNKKVCGSFRIHRFRRSGDVLQEIAATFEQRCGCGSAGLRGCLYYQR